MLKDQPEMALLSVSEMELTSQLRLILQHPDFQALEAAWRGMDLLVSQFGAEENLRLLIIDISKEELAADLRGRNVESSGIFELARRQMEEQPWTVWLGLYSFAPVPADIELLGGLARIAMHAGAPFVSGASSQIVGCDSFEAHPDPADWKLAMPSEAGQALDVLRKSREAAHAGLALPRFLLRQPYGKSSEAIESFPFEELRPDAPHESYLWGNPALLCGYLLAAAFQESGWDREMNGLSEISDLPVHTFKKEAETKMKPCAEAWLSERAAQIIVAAGLIPVVSVKDRGAARVLAFQSLAGHPISIG
jgi:type VI secretion system protein ImpC